jgi:hypothetical protein
MACDIVIRMIHKSVFILGRQPTIGRAELESLFGAEHIEPIGDHAMVSDLSPDDIPFARIGSAIRLAKPLATLKNGPWSAIARAAIKELPGALDYLPLEGKLKLGMSAYGLDVTSADLLRSGLEAKKACKKTGRSVRIVPNTEPTLNTAQVLHNNLTGDLGMEMLFIKAGETVQLAQTVAIQDIDAYTRRDRERPKRDAFVGMLPPKLAQTIVNLGTGQLPPDLSHVVLDPFCGTGVLLQEALLMGYGAYGTDLEPRMVEYTQKNLEWLSTHGLEPNPTLEVGDATNHQWAHPFSVVAGETYLGRPLSSWPSPDKLQEIKGACNLIIQKFLRNLAGQIPSGTRLCLAIPAWNNPNGRIHHLTMLDQLEVLGYNRVSFVWANEQGMVYHRPDQLVARELLIITRK